MEQAYHLISLQGFGWLTSSAGFSNDHNEAAVLGRAAALKQVAASYIKQEDRYTIMVVAADDLLEIGSRR